MIGESYGAGRGGAHEWRTADPSASPYFLSRVAASVSCVWFSLERTTSVVAGESSEAGNPGTLRITKRRVGVPAGIGLRDPRSQKRDLGHPSISPFNVAEVQALSFLSRLASASR